MSETPHKNMGQILCLTLVLLMLTCAPLKAETLKAGVEPWIPWIIKEKGQYTGIVVDICREAVRRAGHQLVIVEIPTKRRDMIEWGRAVDLEPGCEKMWRVREKDVSVFTEPYLETRNVIVTRKGCFPATRSLATFYGSTIGANAGYYYTDGLSPAFEQELITRDDCGPGHQLFSKLLKNRFNAIVADTIEWKYWMARLGVPLSGFEETYMFSHTNHLCIRLHRDKADLVEALNHSLAEMKADHTVDAIIRHYLP